MEDVDMTLEDKYNALKYDHDELEKRVNNIQEDMEYLDKKILEIELWAKLRKG